MAVMIHPFGPKPHPLAEIIPINCTGCGICARAFSAFSPLGIYHRLGRLGNELLVAELLLDARQILRGLLPLLGDAAADRLLSWRKNFFLPKGLQSAFKIT